MTTPIVTELPRTLEPTTADVFVDGAPSHLALVEPGCTPMTDVLTAPTTRAVDAAES